MQCFDLVFGLDLSMKILKITDILTLQSSSMSAADGGKIYGRMNYAHFTGHESRGIFHLLLKNPVNNMVQNYPLVLGNIKLLFVMKMALVMESIQCQLRIIIVGSTMKRLIAPLLE